jgi:hypothetical protein
VPHKAVPEEHCVSRPLIAPPLVGVHGDANQQPGATLLADIESWCRLSDFKRDSVEFISAADSHERPIAAGTPFTRAGHTPSLFTPIWFSVRLPSLALPVEPALSWLDSRASQNLNTESLSI